MLSDDKFDELIDNLANAPLLSEYEIDHNAFRNMAAAHEFKERTTPTEKDLNVLRGLSVGMTQAEIAEDLSLSVEAIRSRAKHVRKVLRARTRCHAVALALRRGLID